VANINLEHILIEYERERRISKVCTLFEEYIDTNNQVVASGIAEALPVIAEVAPDRFIKLYEEHYTEPGVWVTEGVMAFSVRKDLLNIHSDDARKLAAEALGYWVTDSTVDTFVKIINSALHKTKLAGRDDDYLQAGMLQAIEHAKARLSEDSVAKAKSIELKKSKKVKLILENEKTQPRTFDRIYKLMIENEPGVFENRFVYEMAGNNAYLKKEIAKALRMYAETVKDEEIKIIYNAATNFIQNYVKSPYVEGKSTDEIVFEVKQLAISGSIDFSRLNTIFSIGKAKDLTEMVECSMIDISGRYTVTNRIARGGLMSVYRAVDYTGREWAVKLFGGLRDEFLKENLLLSNKEMVENEIRNSMADIDNPHVAKLHVQVTDYGKFLFIEQYIDETLKERIMKRRLIEPEIIDFARQITKGLYACHRLGILHRDIKSDNIGIVASEIPESFQSNKVPYEIIKIFDFGISSLKNKIKEGEKEFCGIFGRPPEGFPEFEAGNRKWVNNFPRAQYTELSEIYALGTVLFEMVTGKTPVEAYRDRFNPTVKLGIEPGKERERTTRYIAKRIGTQEYYRGLIQILDESLEEFKKDNETNEAIKVAIIGCLAPRPEDRYQNIRDVGREFGIILNY
jgi:serine/threonine protein kinase